MLEAYCAPPGGQTEIITDLGSGLNYRKPGLQRLQDLILRRGVARWVRTHRDRLLRFGSELVFALCERQGIEVVIIHPSEPVTFEEELAADAWEIITVFSARLYSRRSHMTKRILKALQEAGDEPAPCRPRTRSPLAPNHSQTTLLARHAGYARVAYNCGAVAEFKAGLDCKQWLSDKDLRPLCNQVKSDRYPWCSTLSQLAAKNATRNAGRAIEVGGAYRQAWYVGFPHFRRKGIHDAHTASNGRDTVAPGRTPGPSAGHRMGPDAGSPAPPLREGATVGIDLGLQTLATLSGGTVYENPRALQAALADLRRVDKAIARSRKAHGHQESKRRNRLCHLRCQLHARVKRIRQDGYHQATSAIAKTYAVVKVKTLHFSGLVKNSRLDRAFSDAGIGDFLRLLEYKCRWYGAHFEKVDRWYPSSRTCSRCGAHKAALWLSERTYRCHTCGLARDRDLNAARNVEAFPAESSPAVQARGGTVRLSHRDRTAGEVCNPAAVSTCA